MKKPNFEENNGPVVAPLDMQKAIITAWGNPDASRMKLGEFIYTERNWIISTAAPRTVQQESKTVAKIETNPEDPAYNDFTIIQQLLEINNDVNTKPITNERIISLPKPTNSPVTMMAAPTAMGVEIILNLLNICISSTDWNVTCHNLETWETKESPPAMVMNQSQCGGVPNCMLTKKHVAWDLVLKTWDEKNKGYIQQKIHYAVSIAPEAPFLARMIDFCYQGIGEFNGQKYPVTICDSVKNFKYETTPATN